MQTLWQDVRYGLRQLRKAPGFALTAILTLALGIGATTAIFTLVYQVILRSIPIGHPEQLYKIGKDIKCCSYSSTQGHWSIFSDDLYRYLRDQTKGTEGIAAVQAGSIMVSAHGADQHAATQSLEVRFVSGNYFSVLATTPYAGRLLDVADDQEGAAPAAVISYLIWQTKFGGDPHLIGSTVMMTGHPVTIVGVTTPKFFGDRNNAEPSGVWIPLSLEPTFEPQRQLLKFSADHWLYVLVRIADAKQVPQIQGAIQGELRQWLAAHPEQFEGVTAKDMAKQTTELVSASGGINNLRANFESSLRLLLLVAGFVLLIACANLANLMLVRGMARQQELAVRSALGAPRQRLIRQTLVEAVLLSILGGAAALVVAYAGTRGILALALPGANVTTLSASPSLAVLGFALALSLVTGIVFGMAPAWITSRTNPVEALRGANRSTRDASALPQKLLVILQAALSLALLSTAGLLVTSLRHLEHQDFHFEAGGRMLLFIDLQAAGYKADRLAGLYQRFDDTFGHLASVESFAYATYAPMSQNNWGGGVFLAGSANSTNRGASYNSVSSHYFQTVGTRIVAGRGITEHDTATSTHVAVVNQRFVNEFYKDKRPIGEHFGPDRHMTGEFEIVGIAEDTKYVDPANPTQSMYFTPITQTTSYANDEKNEGEGSKHFAANIVVHYRGDQNAAASSIRQALHSIDPDIPILNMLTYDDQLSTAFTQEELVVRLTTLFGLLALLLAAIGLYGVTAYAVARRTSEIGIRMALGANRGSVLSMVVRNALTQAAIGVAVGLPLAYAGGKLVQHSLYQTSALQPLVLLSVIVMLMLAALAAAAIPARRAASIDPMRALRTD